MLVILAEWPTSNPDWEDDRIESDFAMIQEVIRSIRDMRARYNISPGKEIEALIKAGGEASKR